MSKRNVVLLVIIVICIFASIIAFAYSYYLGRDFNLENNVIVSSVTPDRIGITLESAGSSISMNIDAEMMMEAAISSNAVATESGDLSVTLHGGTEDNPVTCKYDIYYVWENDVTSRGYTISNKNAKEFTYAISKDNVSVVNETNFVNTFVTPGQLSTPVKVGTEQTITSNGIDTTDTFTIITKFYNIPYDQSANIDSTHNIKFYIVSDLSRCYTRNQEGQIYSNTLAGVVSSLVTSGDDYRVNKDNLPYYVYSDETGIRYAGTNPDNFVRFNDELWRIIGVFDTMYDTDGDNMPDTTAPLVKIIRNDSLGIFKWDNKNKGVGSNNSQFQVYGSNDWGDSQLMYMLNPPEFVRSAYGSNDLLMYDHSYREQDDYIVTRNGLQIMKNPGSYFRSGIDAYAPASTNGTLTLQTANISRLSISSQTMIATAKWYLGSANSNGHNAGTFYNAERSTFTSGRSAYWYGKVGLMYASDYGYATGGQTLESYSRDKCLSTGFNEFNKYNCSNHSWLYYSNTTATSTGIIQNQWPMDRFAADYSMYAWNGGALTTNDAYNTNNTVRPALYLNPNVRAIGGDGSYNSPFLIS